MVKPSTLVSVEEYDLILRAQNPDFSVQLPEIFAAMDATTQD